MRSILSVAEKGDGQESRPLMASAVAFETFVSAPAPCGELRSSLVP
jgi:hypothetical protein